MRSLLPSLQSRSFPRATSKTKEKAKVALIFAAILICCWASGLRPAGAESAQGNHSNTPVPRSDTTVMPDLALANTPQSDLTASPTVVGVGGQVTVVFSENLPNGTEDYLALYRAGDGDGSYMTLKHTNTATNRTIVFDVPNTVDTYNIRYLANSGGNNYYVAATSNSFSVVAAPTPSPTPTPQSDLTVSPTVVGLGGQVIVVFSENLPNGAADYLALYRAGDGDGSFMTLKHTNTATNRTIVFDVPSTVDTYNIRYLANSNGNNYYVAATSNSFSVVAAPTPTPTPGGNYPDTSIPLSSDTTVTPDDPPSNTTSINVSTSADFHGTLEGNPVTGVVRVTNAHPAGTYTVTVKALNSGGASTTKTFALTVTTPATCNPISFAPAVNLGSGGAFSIAVGDFNGDGKQDLAAGDGSIWLGDGHGNFVAVPNSGFGGGVPIVVGDFNGDGKQDLAAGQSNGVSIWLGDGTGHFGAATNFSIGGGFAFLFSSSSLMAIGDFNDDGKQDLVAVPYNSGSVVVLLGDGAGSFGAPILSDPPAHCDEACFTVPPYHPYLGIPVAVAVITNHRIAVGMSGRNFHPPYVAIMSGRGDGTFGGLSSNTIELGLSSYPSAIVVGNFSRNTPYLAVAGSIIIGPDYDFAKPFAGIALAVGDFNGDGKQDLVGDNIWLGDGTGNFVADTNSGFGTQVQVAVGDFNGDGMQDLAVPNPPNFDLSGPSLSIFLRNCAATPPVVSDTFTSTDGVELSQHVGEIGATWAQPYYSSGSQDYLYGNQVTHGAVSYRNIYYASGQPASDCYVQATLFPLKPAAGNVLAGLVLRLDPASENYYYAGYYSISADGANAHYWAIVSNVNGNSVLLGAWAETLSIGDGRTVRFEANGSRLTLFINGISRIDITNSDHPAAGRVGILMSGSASSVNGLAFDNLQAGP